MPVLVKNVCFLVFSSLALGQIHGSVGAIHFSKDEISIAADSRGIVFANKKILDSLCKVTSFDDDLAFVNAGNTVFPFGNSMEEARNAHYEVKQRYGSARGHIEDIANRWGASIGQKFNRLGKENSKQFWALKLPSSGDFVVAMFGGQDASGSLILLSVDILPNPNGTPTTKSDSKRVNDCVGLCAVGASAIIKEFSEGKTDRAKSEAQTWKPQGAFVPGSLEFAMLRTIRAVDLTIKYGKLNEVGGPVDAVQFRRSDAAKHIMWFSRKKNCQEN